MQTKVDTNLKQVSSSIFFCGRNFTTWYGVYVCYLNRYTLTITFQETKNFCIIKELYVIDFSLTNTILTILTILTLPIRIDSRLFSRVVKVSPLSRKSKSKTK